MSSSNSANSLYDGPKSYPSPPQWAASKLFPTGREAFACSAGSVETRELQTREPREFYDAMTAPQRREGLDDLTLLARAALQKRSLDTGQASPVALTGPGAELASQPSPGAGGGVEDLSSLVEEFSLQMARVRQLDRKLAAEKAASYVGHSFEGIIVGQSVSGGTTVKVTNPTFVGSLLGDGGFWLGDAMRVELQAADPQAGTIQFRKIV